MNVEDIGPSPRVVVVEELVVTWYPVALAPPSEHHETVVLPNDLRGRNIDLVHILLIGTHPETGGLGGLVPNLEISQVKGRGRIVRNAPCRVVGPVRRILGREKAAPSCGCPGRRVGQHRNDFDVLREGSLDKTVV